MTQFSNYIFLFIILGIPLYGVFRKVKVYESFIEGAKEGFQVTIRIIPYLVAILVAIGMLRASGAFEYLGRWMGPLLNKIGIPVEVLPVALIRPFSGSGAEGAMVDVLNTYGADSFLGNLAATMVGGTETTFYVLAVYFGAVNIQRTRHAVPAGLVADVVAVFAAVWVCRLML